MSCTFFNGMSIFLFSTAIVIGGFGCLALILAYHYGLNRSRCNLSTAIVTITTFLLLLGAIKSCSKCRTIVRENIDSWRSTIHRDSDIHNQDDRLVLTGSLYVLDYYSKKGIFIMSHVENLQKACRKTKYDRWTLEKF